MTLVGRKRSCDGLVPRPGESVQLHPQGAIDCLGHYFTLPTRTGEPHLNYTICCLELKEEQTITTKFLDTSSVKRPTHAEQNVQCSETYSQVKYRANAINYGNGMRKKCVDLFDFVEAYDNVVQGVGKRVSIRTNINTVSTNVCPQYGRCDQ